MFARTMFFVVRLFYATFIKLMFPIRDSNSVLIGNLNDTEILTIRFLKVTEHILIHISLVSLVVWEYIKGKASVYIFPTY